MFAVPFRSTLVITALALGVVACGDTPEPAAPPAEAPPAQPAAAASKATLASGVVGGTYHDRYAAEIDQRVADWQIMARATAGSTENLDLLSEGKVDLALAQADVFASRIAEEPLVFGPLRIAALLGEECVFVAARIGAGVDGFGDLADDIGGRAAVVHLGPESGGMAETWNHVSSVLPEQSNADVAYGEAGVAALASGDVDAAAWMTDPRNTQHANLLAVQQDANLALLDVEDERLFDLLAGETDVYLPRTIPVGTQGESVDTICTPALLMSHPRTPVGLLEALKTAGIGRL